MGGIRHGRPEPETPKQNVLLKLLKTLYFCLKKNGFLVVISSVPISSCPLSGGAIPHDLCLSPPQGILRAEEAAHSLRTSLLVFGLKEGFGRHSKGPEGCA